RLPVPLLTLRHPPRLRRGPLRRGLITGATALALVRPRLFLFRGVKIYAVALLLRSNVLNGRITACSSRRYCYLQEQYQQ
ncbi:MAG: hypothetical protein Q4F67_14835, partial [Propionibacteriaceae bacterium]|nr:hypothetical protein [Propionibacteriaceae bacterium]